MGEGSRGEGGEAHRRTQTHISTHLLCIFVVHLLQCAPCLPQQAHRSAPLTPVPARSYTRRTVPRILGHTLHKGYAVRL